MRARESASHSISNSSRLTISWKDPSVARDQAAGTVRLAAWIGLFTSYGEIVCLGTQKYLLQIPNGHVDSAYLTELQRICVP